MSRIVQATADELAADEAIAVTRVDLAHVWELVDFGLGPMDCCAKCCIIRRRDDKHLLCKGPHRIDLRSELPWT